MPDTARLFMNGRSQVLLEKTESLGEAMREFFAANDPAPKDFLKRRYDAPPEAH